MNLSTLFLIAFAVTIVLRFVPVKRAPEWLQPVLVCLTAGAAGLVEGYASGLTGELLAAHVGAAVGLSGPMAIGLWHSAKRLPGVAKLTGVLLLAATLASPSACQRPAPKDAHAVLQTAETALVLTSDALAVTIAALPEGQDRAPWEARVERLEQAAALMREAEATLDDACVAGAAAAIVGVEIQCTQCVRVATAVQALACEGGD